MAPGSACERPALLTCVHRAGIAEQAIRAAARIRAFRQKRAERTKCGDPLPRSGSTPAR